MLTLKKFKRFLEISPDNLTKDEFLQECISASVAELNGLVNRRLDFKIYSETINGSGNKFAYLSNFPVLKIKTLQLSTPDGFSDIINQPDTISDSVLIFDAGIIFLKKGYIFPAGDKNIYAEYESGYAGADSWQINTKYNINEFTLYTGSIYRCIAEHISGETFDEDKWQLTSAGLVPADLEKVLKYLAAKQFYESAAGKNLLLRKAETTGGNFSRSLVYKTPDIENIINSYKKANI